MEMFYTMHGRAKEIILEKAIEAVRERGLRLLPDAKEGNIQAHKELRNAIDHIKALYRELIQTRRYNREIAKSSSERQLS